MKNLNQTANLENVKSLQTNKKNLTFSSASGLSSPSVSPCSAFRLIHRCIKKNVLDILLTILAPPRTGTLPSRAHLSSFSSDLCTSLAQHLVWLPSFLWILTVRRPACGHQERLYVSRADNIALKRRLCACVCGMFMCGTKQGSLQRYYGLWFINTHKHPLTYYIYFLVIYNMRTSKCGKVKM